jgi:methionyl-tRNA formyltransferase
MSLRPLRALAGDHEIVTLVRPAGRGSPLKRFLGATARRAGFKKKDALDLWAAERGLRAITVRSPDDPHLVARLRAVQPDLIAISAFPWLLGPDVLAIPAQGALNLHPSLLPRHRGPLPLFWIYHGDDRETGVTVHHVGERADAGDIVLQESFPLPRGFPVDQLSGENARRGARLMARAVADIAGRVARRTVQDDTRASSAPLVRPGARMVDFAGWGVERVWHFLAGLYPRFREPLPGPDGQPIDYRGVLGYEATASHLAPGTVVPARGGWELHCWGGVLRLASPPR